MDTTKGTKAKDSKPFVWVSCCIRQDNKVRDYRSLYLEANHTSGVINGNLIRYEVGDKIKYKDEIHEVVAIK